MAGSKLVTFSSLPQAPPQTRRSFQTQVTRIAMSHAFVGDRVGLHFNHNGQMTVFVNGKAGPPVETSLVPSEGEWFGFCNLFGKTQAISLVAVNYPVDPHEQVSDFYQVLSNCIDCLFVCLNAL
eukprot:c3888_g1_i1.p2 GENE.c3888_g1_i1~~c3888_g1_i1.p2  ORF type:complete len:124 (+),score=16.21 c3888_g1_i1:199-570(+)